jgi:hypothetical protein
MTGSGYTNTRASVWTQAIGVLVPLGAGDGYLTAKETKW